MIMIRPLLLFTGYLLLALSLIMLAPLFYAFITDANDELPFILSFLITLSCALFLITSNNGPIKALRIKQIFLLAPLAWFSFSFMSTLPFFFSNENFSFSNAFFEAVSGLTTTGATIIEDLSQISQPLILWRALLHWVGGIGIITMGIIILPFLRIGGMQLFELDNSAQKTTKILPRASELTKHIFLIYLAFTALFTLALYFAGMSAIEAFCHSASAITTGGFSTQTSSIAYWHDNSWIEMILILAMLCGSLPFIIYVSFIKHKKLNLADPQIKLFFLILFAVTLIIALWLHSRQEIDYIEAFRLSFFNTTSILTTTGFASADYAIWGSFTTMIFFFLIPIGGCTGSTAGGIKTYRIYMLYQNFRQQLIKLYAPHQIQQIHYGHTPISKSILLSISLFITAMFVTIMLIALLIAYYGFDSLTSLTASLACVANIGPGLGDIVGPSGHYNNFPNLAKWALSFGMLLGRLEFMAFFVLLTRSFWAR